MSYLKLFKEGKLTNIANNLHDRLKSCDLCPHKCKVNRLNNEIGFCGADSNLRVSSVQLHFGEEPELVGRGGSGTIFFSYCNLGCIYCQNHSISITGDGHDISIRKLAESMLDLQLEGAENINFVTPTHYIVQIVEALCIAVELGLELPLVYNCGGYESVEILKLVSGIFDIYMPDIKYSDLTVSEKYSKTGDYFEVACSAAKEMQSQVGDLVVEGGIAKKGLLIRHLVLPNGLAGSKAVLDFIYNQISKKAYINIMDQYQPCYKAYESKDISRRITLTEYRSVVEYATKLGFKIRPKE